jgi:2'-5' RNA ligase
MVRLFTAVELDDATRGAVTARQRVIATALRAAGDRDLRLTPPEQLHLTLVFIGNVDEASARRVEDVLVPSIAISPFTLELGACGMFPSSGRPRVLWLGVSRGSEELAELHRTVSGRLDQVGVQQEDRTYHPHLTIGRWRDGGRRSARQAYAAAPWAVSTRVDHVTLFLSRLSPRGAEHTVIGRTPLQSDSNFQLLRCR